MSNHRNKKEAAVIEDIELLMQKHGVSLKEVNAFIRKKEVLKIPLSIFNNKLTPLETIVKYLRENKGMKYSEMESLVGRDQRVLGVTYKRTKGKMPEELETNVERGTFSLEILADDKMSVFERIVKHLKDEKSMNYADIASVMGKDDRTVWTVYKRAKKKEKYLYNE